MLAAAGGWVRRIWRAGRSRDARPPRDRLDGPKRRSEWKSAKAAHPLSKLALGASSWLSVGVGRHWMADGERPEAAEERRSGRSCSSGPTKVSGSVGATVESTSAKRSAMRPRCLSCVQYTYTVLRGARSLSSRSLTFVWASGRVYSTMGCQRPLAEREYARMLRPVAIYVPDRVTALRCTRVHHAPGRRSVNL